MSPSFRNACLLLTAGTLAACSPEEVNIKIGVALPLSGPIAQFGKDGVNGAQIAVDELNSDRKFTINGKHPTITLVPMDDKSDPETGKQVAQALIAQKVSAVYGDLNSGVTIPASALYAQAGIPQISPSTNPLYTRQGFKTTFRILADDYMQGAAIVTLLTEKLHAKSIYVVDDGSPFGTGLADEVSKDLTAKTITAPHDRVNPQNPDYATLMQKIKDSKADVVFFGGDEGSGLPVIKEIRKADPTIKIVTGDALCDVSTIKHAGGIIDSNYFCTIAGIPTSWQFGGNLFTRMYKDKYGTPGAFSIPAYDAIHILTQAMKKANSSDPAVYLPFMTKGPYDGKIQGTVDFDSKGDLKDGTVVTYQAIGGKLSDDPNLIGP